MIATAMGRRGGRTAHGDPDRQRLLHRTRMDHAPLDRRSLQSARPVHHGLLAHPQQQVEPLGEEPVVIVKVVTEERERLDERATTRHDLGPPARQQIDRGELLVNAHRIVGAQHGDRARETDALRAHRGRGQHHRGRGDGEVLAMMLAEPEHVEAELIGERDLGDQVAQALLRRGPLARAG
jgi:hypothetical protein